MKTLAWKLSFSLLLGALALPLCAELKAPQCKATDGSCPDFVLVNWKAARKAVGGYELRRGTSADFAAAQTLLRTTELYHQDITAAVGVEYYYWVGAIDKDGELSFRPEKYDVGYRQGLTTVKLEAEDSGNYINLGVARRLAVKSEGARVLPRTLKVSSGSARATLEKWSSLDGEGYCAAICGDVPGKVKVKAKYAGRSRVRTFHVVDFQLIPEKTEAKIGKRVYYSATCNGEICNPERMQRLEGDGQGVKYGKLKKNGRCAYIMGNSAGQIVLAAYYKGAVATATITILPDETPAESGEGTGEGEGAGTGDGAGE